MDDGGGGLASLAGRGWFVGQINCYTVLLLGGWALSRKVTPIPSRTAPPPNRPFP